MAMGGNLTWRGELTMRFADDVLLNCALETYTIILSHVAPTHFKNKVRITYGAFQ